MFSQLVSFSSLHKSNSKLQQNWNQGNYGSKWNGRKNNILGICVNTHNNSKLQAWRKKNEKEQIIIEFAKIKPLSPQIEKKFY